MTARQPPNEALREHVTRVGFDLSLSKTQIAVLVEIAEFYAKDRPVVGWGSPWSHFVTAAGALQRKGLVWHKNPAPPPKPKSKPSEVWGLTTAGQFVVGLLVESGIYRDTLDLVDRHLDAGYLKLMTAECRT